MPRPSRPAASSPTARRRMERQRRRDTRPETELRRALLSRGVRGYRLDWKLPGMRRRADLAWPGRRIAVFVDGCFWHRCPEHGTRPRANAQWWAEKLDANVARDRATDSALTEAGWTVVRLWEHEDPDRAAASIARLVDPDG